MNEFFWNERYAGAEYAYGINPNGYFKKFIDRHGPGRLLLPGEGEGRNAVYAAMAGWQTDAVDQSEAGMKKALSLAELNKVNINYRVADITEYDFGTDRYDAIALVFIHMPPVIRKIFHSKLAESLKPGGWLILEAFSKEQVGYTSGGPGEAELLYDKEILSGDFRMLSIEELTETTEILKEGKYHNGEAVLIRMKARKK